MSIYNPERLFWRVMRGKFVHSTWSTAGEAQHMADRLNIDSHSGADLSFHVEAWS